MPAKPRPRDFMPFKAFVQRSQVLSLYRQFFRATGSLGPAAADIRKEVRTQFRLYKGETDEKYIRTLIVQGSRQLDQVRVMVSTAVPKSDATPGTQGSPFSSPAFDKEHRDLDTQPVPVEVREVGKGWPWERKK